MREDLKELLKEFLIMAVLLLWVVLNIGFTERFFEPFLKIALELQIVDWLVGVGFPEALVGINVFLACATFFVLTLCAPPFLLWLFIERTRRRKDAAAKR